MLASILPGLRGVRAPFAAGSLLLAALYVGLYSRFHAGTDAARLGPGVDSLLRLLGRQGRLAILGVTVYFVGTVFVLILRILTRTMSIRRVPRVLDAKYLEEVQRRPGWPLRRSSTRTWTMAVIAPFSRNSARRILVLCKEDQTLAGKVCCEIIKGGGKLLLARNKDLYIEWDRIQAEAEFRDAVAVPAVVFVVSALMAFDWSLWAKASAVLSVTAVSAMLWWHARRLEREANSLYAHLVADGIVATASLDATPAALKGQSQAPGVGPEPSSASVTS